MKKYTYMCHVMHGVMHFAHKRLMELYRVYEMIIVQASHELFCEIAALSFVLLTSTVMFCSSARAVIL